MFLLYILAPDLYNTYLFILFIPSVIMSIRIAVLACAALALESLNAKRPGIRASIVFDDDPTPRVGKVGTVMPERFGEAIDFTSEAPGLFELTGSRDDSLEYMLAKCTELEQKVIRAHADSLCSQALETLDSLDSEDTNEIRSPELLFALSPTTPALLASLMWTWREPRVCAEQALSDPLYNSPGQLVGV